jgi:hypothetical protein
MEAGVSARLENFVDDYAETLPEEASGGEDECGEDEFFDQQEAAGVGGEDWACKQPKRRRGSDD